MITTFLPVLLFLINLSTSTSTPTPTPTPAQLHKLLTLSLQPHHKFPLNIDTAFSHQSDISVVVTSCNRHELLSVTLNSFFHYNTYPLRLVVVVEDCGGDCDAVWGMLPEGASEYEGEFFQVVCGQERRGQIQAIDVGYAYVESKYVYHLEDDWVMLGPYGFLQRMKDTLQHPPTPTTKISQATLTLPSWSWSHMPSPLFRTPHHTKYHLLSTYSKSYTYKFSFNPHLLDFERIYKGELNGSYMRSVAERYHCTGGESGESRDGGQGAVDAGCVEHYTGELLDQRGYKQVFVDLKRGEVCRHVGGKGEYGGVEGVAWLGDSYNFEGNGRKKLEIKQNIDQDKAQKQQVLNTQSLPNKTNKNQPNSTPNKPQTPPSPLPSSNPDPNPSQIPIPSIITPNATPNPTPNPDPIPTDSPNPPKHKKQTTISYQILSSLFFAISILGIYKLMEHCYRRFWEAGREGVVRISNEQVQ